MPKITQDNIQSINNSASLMHFLRERMDLPIPEKAALEQIALPLPLPFLGFKEFIAEQIIDCQDFKGLSQDILGERRPFLIRFRRKSNYPEILRDVAESLYQKATNPANLLFICAAENFQPFAFAYFNNSESGDWQAAVLTILAWTQNDTRIHTNSEHELPVSFFSDKSSAELDDFRDDATEVEKEDDFGDENVIPDEPEDNIEASPSEDQGRVSSEIIVKRTSSDGLLAKLQNTGAPLSRYGNIYSGILTGYNDAFVIDEFKRQQLIGENSASSELIKSILIRGQKWKAGSAYLIWIPSSKNKHWPWSEARNETEAKWIFEEVYPAISKHLKRYENNLKSRNHQGQFYWEFTASNLYFMPKQSKIIYQRRTSSMQAAYDTSEALPLFEGRFIPTKDLSLLAILNSTLFNWYVQTYKVFELNNRPSDFKNAFMKNVPIAERTEAQKVEISQLVQQILAAPDSLAVPDFEKKIDALVYELYGLTDAEIGLITEHEQLPLKPQDRTTSLVTPTNAQQATPARSQTQTKVDRLLAVLENTEPQLAVSPLNLTEDDKPANQSITPISSDALLAKLQNTGVPLEQHWNIYTGITPGRVKAFVIDKSKGLQMISGDARNSELIKPLARVPKASRWKPEPAHLIWISSSQYKWWPWSDMENESEAERIFEDTYPLISQHLINYRDILKNHTSKHKGKFYWELALREPRRKNYPAFYQPKIIYPIHSNSMRAFYDSSESFILGSSYCIPTDDLSLLAILNSTLFDWYAQTKCKAPGTGNSLILTMGNMESAPIAPRTAEQKAELSQLVQQILDTPNSPAVPALEEEINMLVYDLYELNASEIALIEEESNQ